MKRSEIAFSPRARDDGLRRIRKLTWRIGLVAAAGTAVVFSRFAHLTPTLPHLPQLGGSSSQSGTSPGSSSQSGTSSQGISSSQGVSPASGGGQAVSGGS